MMLQVWNCVGARHGGDQDGGGGAERNSAGGREQRAALVPACVPEGQAGMRESFGNLRRERRERGRLVGLRVGAEGRAGRKPKRGAERRELKAGTERGINGSRPGALGVVRQAREEETGGSGGGCAVRGKQDGGRGCSSLCAGRAGGGGGCGRLRGIRGCVGSCAGKSGKRGVPRSRGERRGRRGERLPPLSGAGIRLRRAFPDLPASGISRNLVRG